MIPKWMKWRYYHWFVFHCTHPKGCKRCSWCGYGLEPKPKPEPKPKRKITSLEELKAWNNERPIVLEWFMEWFMNLLVEGKFEEADEAYHEIIKFGMKSDGISEAKCRAMMERNFGYYCEKGRPWEVAFQKWKTRSLHKQ